MKSSTLSKRLLIVLTASSWLALLIFDELFFIIPLNSKDNQSDKYIHDFFATLYFISSFYLFRGYFKDIAIQKKLIDKLKKLFRVAAISLLASALLKIALLGYFFLENELSFFFRHLMAYIDLALATSFGLTMFFTWKQFIFYQKSSWLQPSWLAMEIGIVSTAILSFSQNFDLSSPIWPFVFIPFFIISSIFSVRLKWIAYLNYDEKLLGLLMLSFTGLSLAFFSGLFINDNLLSGQLLIWETPFLIAIGIFCVLYLVASILVLIFNLPTSSVFEKKLEEVFSLQEISEKLDGKHSESEIFEILLNTCLAATQANSAWLEIFGRGNDNRKYFTENIGINDVMNIISSLNRAQIPFSDGLQIGNTNEVKELNGILTRSSLYCKKITIDNKPIAQLVLIKKVAGGFDEEMLSLTSTFVNQATKSVQNFRLLNEKLANERYKEELKIARKVQDAMLPKTHLENDFFELHAISNSANEVGGDYFDYFQIDEDNWVVIIADVSGKGTVAAFSMAQLKGIIHALVKSSTDPKNFLIKCNQALISCLPREMFATLSYFKIDIKKQAIRHFRGGHCPAIVTSGTSEYWNPKGMGLGFLNGQLFEKSFEESEITYKDGDSLLMFTDGFTEASNEEKEELGYDRMLEWARFFDKKTKLSLPDLFYQKAMDFIGKEQSNDDMTMVYIKFKTHNLNN